MTQYLLAVVFILLTLSTKAIVGAEPLREIPALPVAEISTRMQELLKNDAGLPWNVQTEKLIGKLSIHNYYEIILLFNRLNNVTITDNQERICDLAARKLDELYDYPFGATVAANAETEIKNQRVLSWIKLYVNLTCAYEGRSNQTEPLNPMPNIDVKVLGGDRNPSANDFYFTNSGVSLSVEVANPMPFTINIELPAPVEMQKQIKVAPAMATATIKLNDLWFNQPITAKIPPYTKLIYKMPLAIFIKTNYVGDIKIESKTHHYGYTKHTALTYKLRYELLNTNRNLIINNKFPLNADIGFSENIRQMKPTIASKNYWENLAKIKEELAQLRGAELAVIRFYNMDLPEKYRPFIEKGKFAVLRQIPYEFAPLSTNEEHWKVTLLDVCNELMSANYLSKSQSDITESNDGINDSKTYEIENYFDYEWKTTDGNEELRGYFNRELSTEKAFILLSRTSSWKLFGDSFFVFDERKIENYGLKLTPFYQEYFELYKEVLQPLKFIGKRICDYAAARESLYLRANLQTPRSVEYFRKFYSLLDLHICRKNLLDYGLAGVNVTPVSINDKTFALNVKYTNHSKYPLELYLATPEFLGITQSSIDNGENWSESLLFGDKRQPERVLIPAGATAERLIAVNRLFDDLKTAQTALTMDLDLYARLIVPEMEMDFPEPFGTRIRTRQTVNFTPLISTADNAAKNTAEYQQLLTSLQNKLSSKNSYTRSTALEVANFLSPADQIAIAESILAAQTANIANNENAESVNEQNNASRENATAPLIWQITP